MVGLGFPDIARAKADHIARHTDQDNTEQIKGSAASGMMEDIRSAGQEDDNDNDGGTGTGVVVKPKVQTKKPSLYRVLMLNDDYTPMEFVVHVLERFFNKTREESTRIMLHVHKRGVGVCGVFTYEIAETKVQQVMDFARQHQHPLQCTLEKE